MAFKLGKSRVLVANQGQVESKLSFKTPDASIPGTVASGVYYFPVENTTEGSDTWGMVFAEGKNTNNSRYFLMPDSASAP